VHLYAWPEIFLRLFPQLVVALWSQLSHRTRVRLLRFASRS
jgi:hypothetical protein